MGYTLFLAALVAVSTSVAAPPPTLGELVASKGERYDLGTAALVIAREFNPQVDVHAYSAKLDALASKVAPRLSAKSTAKGRLDVLAHFLYHKQHFADRAAMAPDVYVGLNEVLDKRQWNCLGLSLLYVTLGERLGLPLQLVLGPGHALVRYHDKTHTLFIETTDQGRIHSDSSYLKTYLPNGALYASRFHALNKRETVSAILYQTTLGVYPGARNPKAIPYLRQALAICPDNAEAWAGLGAALRTAGDTDDAVQAYRKAIKLDPKLVEAYGGLGNLLHAEGKLHAAIAEYRQLLTVSPNEPKGNYNLAHLLYQAGDYTDALTAYRKYVKYAPITPTDVDASRPAADAPAAASQGD